MSPVRSSWYVLVLELLVATPLAGQAAERLSGRIIGSEGTGVGAAMVTTTQVTEGGGGVVRATTSDGTGRFDFGDLPLGTYRVTVRRIGFEPLTLDPVVLEAGKAQSVLIRLTAAPFRLDSIIATVEPVVTVDRLTPELSRSVTQRELVLLPTGNDVRTLVGFLPGVRPNQIWGGATAQANNYLLDGIPVNHPGLGGDFLEPSVLWVDRIEVKGLGTGAEYGDFQGGIVNVITKSGGRRLEGAFRSSLESHSLNSSNLRSTEIGQEPGSRWEAGGIVGGPLGDNLTFAGFGSLITSNQRVLNHVRFIPGDLSPAVPEMTEVRLLGKLAWNLSAADAVTLSAARFHSAVERFGLEGFESPEATQRRSFSNLFYNLSWRRSASATSTFEVRVGGVRGSDRLEPYAGFDVPGQRTIEPDPKHYQNAEFRERKQPRSVTLSARWDADFRILGVASRVKVGGEHTAASWLAERRRNGGMTWRPWDRIHDPVFVPTDPSTWASTGPITSTWGGEVSLDAGLSSSALFVQDDINLNRFVALNVGLRLGRWSGRIAPTIGQPRFGAVRDVAVEPRLGVSIDPLGRGRIAVKAHWGRFHQGLFAGLFDRAEGTAVFNDEERWDYSGPLFTDPATRFTPAERDGLASQGQFEQTEVIRLSEVGRVTDYRQPFVNQFVASVEASLGAGQHWKAEAAFVARTNRNMVALVDRNLASNYTVFDDVRVLDRFDRAVFFGGEELLLPELAISNEDLIREWELFKSGQTLMFQMPPGMSPANLDALTYSPDLVLTTVPEARRRFRQLQLIVNGRYPGWWLSASTVITSLRGNLNSVTGNDDDSRSGAGPYVRRNEQFNALGSLSNHSKVEVKLQTGGGLPMGLRGGLSVRYATGDPVTPYLLLSNLLLKFDMPYLTHLPPAERTFSERLVRTTTGQRIYLLPRGSLRYPAQGTVDLHVERSFQVGQTLFTVSTDGFNLLGADAMTEMQASLTGEAAVGEFAGYGRVLNRLSPRTIRIGVTVSR